MDPQPFNRDITHMPWGNILCGSHKQVERKFFQKFGNSNTESLMTCFISRIPSAVISLHSSDRVSIWIMTELRTWRCSIGIRFDGTPIGLLRRALYIKEIGAIMNGRNSRKKKNH